MTCQQHLQLGTQAVVLQEAPLRMHHRNSVAQVAEQISRVPGVWVLLDQSQRGHAMLRVAAMAKSHPVLALCGMQPAWLTSLLSGHCSR